MTDLALPNIRPMTLAELLDRAIHLYRQSFLKFIGIYAIPYIPLTIIQSVLSIFSTTSINNFARQSPSNFPLTPETLAAFGGMVLVAIVQFIFVSGFATAALTSAIANNYAGRSIGILDAYRSMSARWLKLLLALFLVGILIIALFIWMFIPCIGWFTGPGILLFISLAVSPLISPIIVLEKLEAGASLRRAWDLARSRFWWLMGCVIVLTLLGQLIVTGPVYLINFILQFAMKSIPGSFLQQTTIAAIIQNLTTMTLSLLYAPLQLTVMTLVYFDLRARSEGLDLAMQMPGAPTPGEVENVPIQLPEIATKSTAPLLTSMDIGRFTLLSFAGILFYFIIVAFVWLVGLAFL